MKSSDVRNIAMGFPQVTEEPHFASTSFRIKGKIFATMPPGDEHLHVFVPEEVREPALAMEPEFLQKLFWGGKVCGLRVSLHNAKPQIVANLLQQACEHKAHLKTPRRRKA